MVNMEFHEQYLTAYCMKYPDFINIFDIELVENTTFHNILKMIKDNSQTDSVLPSTLATWVNGDYSKYGMIKIEVDSVFTAMDTFSYTSKEIMQQDLRKVLEELSKRDETKNIINIFYKAIEYCEQGLTEKAVNLAKSITFRSQKDVMTGLLAIIEASKNDTPSIPVGITAIDNATGGFTRGNLIHIVGDTGSMKTMVSFWICMNILKTNKDLTCCYFEKEMPVKDISIRMLAYELNINIDVIMKSKNIHMYVDMFNKKMENNPETKSMYSRLKVVDFENFTDAFEMRMIIEEYKPDIWCLDFFTMLDNKKSKDGFAFAKEQGEALKATANYTNSVGIILSQTKQNTVEDRNMKVPRKSDGEYSSKINQLCQMNFATFFPITYYSEGYLETLDARWFYLIPLKSRNSALNKLGSICLEAYPAQCFYNEATGENKKEMLTWINKYKYKRE